MVALLSKKRALRSVMVFAGAALIIILALLAVPPATASAAEAVTTCNPTSSNACVNGILQDSSKQAIAGVQVTLGGEESATTTTDSSGKWAFSVTADGEYTVSLPSDVMKNHGLKSDKATVTVKKGDFSKARQVVRFDEAQESGGAQSGSSASPESSDTKASTQASSGQEESAFSNFMSRFWQQLFSGVIFGLMLGLMSVGMNLVYGTTKLSSFSHGEQVSLGGLMAYVGTQILHWPLVLSAILAVAVGAATGLLQNELVWKPLRRRHIGPMQQMIVTIGLSMALQYVFQFFFGGDVKGITTSVPQGFQMGPITTDFTTLMLAGIALVVIIAFTLFLYGTRLGRATRAVSDNPALASASGINVEQVVRVVWIISTALAALSGVLIGIYLNGIAWNTGALMLLLMFSAVTLGGLGTANGALVGSLVIGVVADMSSLVIPDDMRYVSALAILIVVLLIRPQGIFGKQQRVG
ncbi:ABC transporter permease subunit [Bifidobacterium psychraerophilum]|uniref:ABC transporter permease subunit n=1 Tax=Bifidobacterium psychraerophilum TaxID=218140 RepID=UPI0023F6170E|nr:SdrD B-like domain-containing protein [Bifidobacterium psychraerophilum]MCI2176257.1 carboxypeptidase regulatory-like domain-containing protein [Bifidobacterium psychraerophilum]MCI2181269.1 carboxypeptidase regulatory-like domain-containing protein [Bifidobacterium psychraerophilum]